MVVYKFTVSDKDIAKKIKSLLKNKDYYNKSYVKEPSQLKKGEGRYAPINKNIDKDKEINNIASNLFEAFPEQIKDIKTTAIDDKPEKPKRKRMTKEQKDAKKKNRTPEQQQKINERMAKIRAARLKKKK